MQDETNRQQDLQDLSSMLNSKLMNLKLGQDRHLNTEQD